MVYVFSRCLDLRVGILWPQRHIIFVGVNKLPEVQKIERIVAPVPRFSQRAL